MPRCDLLVWILVSKLATTYYTKLGNLLTSTGRDYRELCSWRKEFKRTWKKLETREITLPINDAYRPNTTKWTCTCPFFVTSRFLICKHLIQRVHRVPAIFFLEVKRHRSVPFWRHASLKVLDDEDLNEHVNMAAAEEDYDDELPDASDEEEEEFDDAVEAMGGRTFNEVLSDDIDLIAEFLAGLKFQRQFRDQRFLNVLEREGAGFFRLAKSCLEMERKLKRSVGDMPLTWDKSTITTMFYRPRPTVTDADIAEASIVSKSESL